jgi:hypothetical protein
LSSRSDLQAAISGTCERFGEDFSLDRLPRRENHGRFAPENGDKLSKVPLMDVDGQYMGWPEVACHIVAEALVDTAMV